MGKDLSPMSSFAQYSLSRKEKFWCISKCNPLLSHDSIKVHVGLFQQEGMERKWNLQAAVEWISLTLFPGQLNDFQQRSSLKQLHTFSDSFYLKQLSINRLYCLNKRHTSFTAARAWLILKLSQWTISILQKVCSCYLELYQRLNFQHRTTLYPWGSFLLS